MDWRDEGALLAVRRHGESAAIIEVFTAAHGRHAGVVRGGASRKIAPLLRKKKSKKQFQLLQSSAKSSLLTHKLILSLRRLIQRLVITTIVARSLSSLISSQCQTKK